MIGTSSILSIIKNSSYAVAFIIGAGYFGFSPESIVLLGALTIIDLITGVIRVWNNEGGSSITSEAIKKGFTSKFLLWSSLMGVAIASRALGMDFQNVAQGFMTVLILGELYSILGNVYSARTGKKKVEYDVVAWALSKVKIIIDDLMK